VRFIGRPAFSSSYHAASNSQPLSRIDRFSSRGLNGLLSKAFLYLVVITLKALGPIMYEPEQVSRNDSQAESGLQSVPGSNINSPSG
jgi:hypothetical protein